MKARILILILTTFSYLANGQIVVNELMASNSNTIKDNTGAFSDWIEIYNSGNTTIDLHNHFLSDNPEKLDKFQLKGETGTLKIASKGFLIIWCSGFPNRGSNHVSFSLSANSETIVISNPDQKVISQLDFKDQRKDVSYGRTTDGGTELKYFKEASPDKSNKNKETYLGVLASPVFSKKGGFYDNSFTLTISHIDPLIKIFYTEDGSIPDEQNLSGKNYFYKNQYAEIPGQSNGPLLTGTIKSTVYQTPINVKSKKDAPNYTSLKSSTWHYVPFYIPQYLVPKATVIRAVGTKAGYLGSEIVTETYFLDKNYNKNPEFDLISLNIQEDHLFSFESGVYNAGKLFEEYRLKNPTATSEFCTPGNFTNEGDLYEKPINFELFRADSQAVNQNISFKIHGACSRSIPYKSIRLYGRNDFNKFPFFKENPELIQDNFILRNSGDDYMGTLFRDVFSHKLMGHFNFGSQKTQPSVVYINGEYWGIHDIRERLDKYYLNRRYAVNLENIDLRKIIWNGPDETEYGDDIHFTDMINFLNNNNLSINQNYEKAITYLDPESLIDYQIAEIFIGNVDWPQNNVRLWRNKTPNYAPFAPTGLDGRWRYLFYDADKSLGMIVNAQLDALEIALQKDENSIFKAFIKNENFRNKFILRFLDQLNTTFEKSNSLKIFNELMASYSPEVENHIKRWKTIGSFAQWQNNCKVVEKYLNERPESSIRFLKNSFGQYQEKTLTVSSIDQDMGFVRVNSVNINADQPGVTLKNDGTWQGKYFKELPFNIVAKPLPGHRFLYWEHNNEKITDSVLVVFLNQDDSYKAYFEQIAQANESNIPPSSLADCGYFLKEWSSFSAKGSTPPNAKFVFLNQRDPSISSKVAGFTSGEFNHENRSRIVGLEKEGVSFVNTGGPAEHDGYPFGQLGGIIIAANTLGIDSAWVSWNAKTITPGDRKYGLKLFYRVGTSEDFRELDQKTDYVGNKTAKHTTKFERIPLPKSAINQPYVQFFWKYYYTGQGKSGSRDELGLDDISFETNLDFQIPKSNGSLTEGILSHLDKIPSLNSFKVTNTVFEIKAENFSSVRPKPPVISSKKTDICGTEKLILKANGCFNGTMFWSNGEVGKEITVTEGSYYAYCSASCGISENSNALIITRVSKTSAPMIEAAKDKICAGESVTLKANFCAGEVFWSTGQTAKEIRVKPTSIDTYSARCESNQCTSDESEKKKIIIGLPNKPSIKVNQAKLCIGETAYLSSENCDGQIEWSNNSVGEILKFVAEKQGEFVYHSRCNSIDETCFSAWSNPQYLTVNKAESSPKTLAELVYDCSSSSLDLKSAILDSSKNNIAYIFHNGPDFSKSPISSTKNVATGEYYVYKKNQNGCNSMASKINVKSVDCNSKIAETNSKTNADLAIYLNTNKSIVSKNEEIELDLKIHNTGVVRASDIVVDVELPWNLSYIAESSNAKVENNILIFSTSGLNPKGEISYKIKGKVTQSARSLVAATIRSFDQNDANLENNKVVLDLFSANGLGLSLKDGETQSLGNSVFEKSIELYLVNTSHETISPVQIRLNLNKAFGSGAKFLKNELKIETNGTLVLNKDFDATAENQTILIDSLSFLKAQSKQNIRVTFRVDLSQSSQTQFQLNAESLYRNAVLEVSANGSNPDPDYDGDFGNNSEPTILKYNLEQIDNSAIGISQNIVDSVKTDPYNQHFTLMALVKNLGNTELKNINIYNNLRESFGADILVRPFGKTAVSRNSALIINENFDGSNDVNLLQSSDLNVLKSGETDTLFYTINLNQKDASGPYFHNLIVNGTSKNGKTVADTSNNGFQIIPQFSDPTIFRLSEFYKDKIIVLGGFSPNNDQINDELSIFIPNGIQLEFLEIFNRWGVKVAEFFERDVLDNYLQWNGQSGSEGTIYNIADGTYFYVLKVKNDNKVYSNFITVKK